MQGNLLKIEIVLIICEIIAHMDRYWCEYTYSIIIRFWAFKCFAVQCIMLPCCAVWSLQFEILYKRKFIKTSLKTKVLFILNSGRNSPSASQATQTFRVVNDVNAWINDSLNGIKVKMGNISLKTKHPRG